MAETGADGEEHFRAGKLNLVDLAGSERQSKTQVNPQILTEGGVSSRVCHRGCVVEGVSSRVCRRGCVIEGVSSMVCRRGCVIEGV